MKFIGIVLNTGISLRAFGVLKQRWCVIDHSGERLRYTPLKTCKISMCCFILHNIYRKHRVLLLCQHTPSPTSAALTVIRADDDGEEAHEFHDGRFVHAAIAGWFA